MSSQFEDMDNYLSLFDNAVRKNTPQFNEEQAAMSKRLGKFTAISNVLNSLVDAFGASQGANVERRTTSPVPYLNNYHNMVNAHQNRVSAYNMATTKDRMALAQSLLSNKLAQQKATNDYTYQRESLKMRENESIANAKYREQMLKQRAEEQKATADYRQNALEADAQQHEASMKDREKDRAHRAAMQEEEMRHRAEMQEKSLRAEAERVEKMYGTRTKGFHAAQHRLVVGGKPLEISGKTIQAVVNLALSSKDFMTEERMEGYGFSPKSVNQEIDKNDTAKLKLAKEYMEYKGYTPEVIKAIEEGKGSPYGVFNSSEGNDPFGNLF